MTRYYDKKNDRLVYVGKASNKEYWDQHWNKNTIEKLYLKNINPFDYVIRTTKKYLKTGSQILEGGCGTGQQVFKLQNSGYKVIGVDYAKRTVEVVAKSKPELDIRLGDVRSLDFHDCHFDGYWSFGVIEHFYNGYDDILIEMKRVIKIGGYLFITFPHMNKLRKIKARKNKYIVWDNDKTKIQQFYQFALNENKVITDLNQVGFSFIKKQHLAGIKGLKDEIGILKNSLQKIFDSQNYFGIAISKIISLIFNGFSSHSILLVFQNK